MPYLSAYRENNVGLDISDMRSDVEVKIPVPLLSLVAVPLCWLILRPIKGVQC